ncbi:hypothetical protein HLK59_10380 [Streptomyces sp. S3(2020)]|uniref:hypothetical protein n=1 Tax=Streptomyces sp. S3(2020) TaxID=2732044 RepID=UPI001488F113|nr:hypothetical protein [Streptomyces sp. S3(2020)]NNN30764.1 hypothetical protein [Streptomyces sp. S3(2020)]
MPTQPPRDQFGPRRAAARLNSIRMPAGGLPTQREGLRRVLSTEFLPVYFDAFEDGNDWEFRALRTSQWVARQWARRESDLAPLLDSLYEATDDVLSEVLKGARLGSAAVDDCARRAAVLGSMIIAAVVFEYERARDSATAAGPQPRAEHEVMKTLLGSGRSDGSLVHVVAEAHVLVAVRLSGVGAASAEEAFYRHGGLRTLCLLGRGGGYVIIPGCEPSAASAIAERVHAELGGGWLVVEQGDVSEMTACRERADVLLDLAAALYDPGVYRLRDMLVEYTAVTTPSVATRLLGMIGPVLSRPALLQTLTAVIAAHGDRVKAGHRLNLRPGVVDQRCLRIEVLTGQELVNGSLGLTALSSALAAHALCGLGAGEC